MNVQNFGSTWLKPPGVPKTLHQMREEKREQEEHQEAMRREQLAQELAEAEGGGTMDEGMMDDVQLDGAQDLDDEIPDADDAFNPSSDDGEEDDDDDDEDVDDEEYYEQALDEQEVYEDTVRQETEYELEAARMRMTDDAFREALVRGDPEADGSIYGSTEEEEDDESRSQIFDEDDFAHGGTLDNGMAGDMDADLDDHIPEADDGGYEHTDSEADEEGDSTDLSFMPARATLLETPGSPTLPRQAGSHTRQGSRTRPRVSMDLSSLLLQDESSFMTPMASSPSAMGRR